MQAVRLLILVAAAPSVSATANLSSTNDDDELGTNSTGKVPSVGDDGQLTNNTDGGVTPDSGNDGALTTTTTPTTTAATTTTKAATTTTKAATTTTTTTTKAATTTTTTTTTMNSVTDDNVFGGDDTTGAAPKDVVKDSTGKSLSPAVRAELVDDTKVEKVVSLVEAKAGMGYVAGARMLYVDFRRLTATKRQELLNGLALVGTNAMCMGIIYSGLDQSVATNANSVHFDCDTASKGNAAKCTGERLVHCNPLLKMGSGNKVTTVNLTPPEITGWTPGSTTPLVLKAATFAPDHAYSNGALGAQNFVFSATYGAKYTLTSDGNASNDSIEVSVQSLFNAAYRKDIKSTDSNGHDTTVNPTDIIAATKAGSATAATKMKSLTDASKLVTELNAAVGAVSGNDPNAMATPTLSTSDVTSVTSEAIGGKQSVTEIKADAGFVGKFDDTELQKAEDTIKAENEKTTKAAQASSKSYLGWSLTASVVVVGALLF